MKNRKLLMKNLQRTNLKLNQSCHKKKKKKKKKEEEEIKSSPLVLRPRVRNKSLLVPKENDASKPIKSNFLRRIKSTCFLGAQELTSFEKRLKALEK